MAFEEREKLLDITYQRANKECLILVDDERPDIPDINGKVARAPCRYIWTHNICCTSYIPVCDGVGGMRAGQQLRECNVECVGLSLKIKNKNKGIKTIQDEEEIEKKKQTPITERL